MTIEPLYQVKLLSALRSGDPALIHPFLAEIARDKQSRDDDEDEEGIDTGAAALHLAIRCASASTISLLLSHRAISPNAVYPPKSGTTPLHLSASLGRTDVVHLLLAHPETNDTLKDAQGRGVKDVVTGDPRRRREIARAVDEARREVEGRFRGLLRNYIASPAATPTPPALVALLASPRAAHLDLNYLDPQSGTTLLHEAARRHDMRLIELSVRAGADVFLRDRRGRMPVDVVGADEKVKVFLRQFANQNPTLLAPSTPPTEAPTLRGYLNKYTNVAKGYNTRWFVLKGGVLSYYRHQEDETIASRGSISMKTAILKTRSPSTNTSTNTASSTFPSSSSSDKLRFEIHSSAGVGGGGGGGAQKWFVKANHPVEAARWVNAIRRSIEWCNRDRDRDVNAGVNVGGGGGSVGGGSVGGRRSEDSYDSANASANPGHGGVGGRASASVKSKSKSISKSMAKAYIPFKKRMSTSASISRGGGDGYSSAGEVADASRNMFEAQPALATDEEEDDEDEEEEEDEDDDEEEDEDDTSGSSYEKRRRRREPPHEATYAVQGTAVLAQLEATSGLLSSPSLPTSSSPSQTLAAESLHTTHTLLTSYLSMTRDRETWWARQLRRERRRGRLWEESLEGAVREGEVLERELARRARAGGRGVMVTQHAGEGETAPLQVKQPLKQSPLPPLPTLPHRATPTRSGTDTTITSSSVSFTTATASTASPSLSPSLDGDNKEQEQEQGASPYAAAGAADKEPPPTLASYDTDEEDEFFDAIESNNLPNLVIHESIVSPTRSEQHQPPPPYSSTSTSTSSSDLPLEPYTGYANLRTRLNLNNERPSTSLWSVLKHSIGKDLTKISFPVFFNEPTSMLQRMAEDMEFSECLDVAANEHDPLRRIAFVAAFAMSNYSSTIGRIAKPFNPMLSETFEYVRIDKKYRYVSEQVSHHPPISACWAESPSWHYYGEVDAQNKFMGKSFEIRPTGVAHAELMIPEEWAKVGAEKGYPKARVPGKVVEHYSWKKVTTNVSGFILGSPTIDHYGDMIVKNHRTGDQCILTFKPRGWRGKDAYEVSGQVIDANGEVAYDIAGRWNSQLVAKQRGVGGPSGFLNPDLSVHGLSSPTPSPEYILLWRNSPKPPGSPFNLTPFAITLNDCPKDTLKPYLCPTDCRLRPDQRAFEIGKYEAANELKQMQEEKQRAIRKAREEGRRAPHVPRWFRAETDGDTGERVWEPVRADEGDGGLEYWVERERVWREGGGRGRWNGVEEIFIEEPEFIGQAE